MRDQQSEETCVHGRETDGRAETHRKRKRLRQTETDTQSKGKRNKDTEKETQRQAENARHKSGGRAALRAHGTHGQTRLQAERLPELHGDPETLPSSLGGAEELIVEPGGVCRESQEGSMAASCPQR